MSFIVRVAVLEDKQATILLWRSCGLVASYNDPSADFEFAVAGPNSAVLIAENTQADIMGSVMVGHDGHRGWLYYLAAAPRERGQGVGRSMVDAGEAWLQQRRVPKVQLMVRPTNTAIVSFYERLGFEEMPRVLMSKWLNLSE